MNLSDIIALAKSGYSVADVRELMKMDTKTTEPTTVENVQTEEVHTEKEDVQNVTADTEHVEVRNYKNEYEELVTKNAELEKQIAYLQGLNTRKTINIGTEDDFATSFSDLARNFM